MSTPTGHAVQLASGAIGILTAQVFAAEVLNVDWVKAVATLGLSTALVLFFVLTSWSREKRMGDRISKLENSQLSKATDVLQNRPCFAFDSLEDFRDWKAWWAEEKKKRKSRHTESG